MLAKGLAEGFAWDILFNDPIIYTVHPLRTSVAGNTWHQMRRDSRGVSHVGLSVCQVLIKIVISASY